MEKAKLKGKIYTLTERRRQENLKTILLLMVSFFILMQISQIPFELVFVLVSIFAVGIMYLMTERITTQLCIYDTGLKYQFGVTVIFADWDSLSYFKIVHHQAGTTIYVMQADDNATGIPLSDTNNVPFHFDSEYCRWMVNTKEFLKTDLGRDLFYRAPHLFKNEEQLPEKQKDAKGWLTRN
jgi:hypothetical protein